MGEVITNQYEGKGVIFSGASGEEEPLIKEDEDSPTSPVLAPSWEFQGPIHAQFVIPGTTTQATVSNLSMDIGYIDDPDSTKLVVETTTGPIELYAEEEGTDFLESSATNITGFSIEEVSEEEAGYGIDNVAFTGPEAPPPPPPPPPAAHNCSKYLEIDSRGSGEKAGILSPPGEEVYIALEGQLGYGHEVGIETNPYSAVGVFSWTGIKQDLNGFGALIHKGQIGAYKASVREGTKDLSAIISSQISGCSSTRLILVGYSQGAQVTGDVYQELSPKAQQHVAAVALFGDPLYNHTDKAADKPPNRLRNGTLGTRPKFPTGHGIAEVFSYCQIYDPVCQWRIPWWAYVRYRLNQHKEYWGDNDAPADQAGVAVARLLGR
ncbi:MAG: cutinase family protein [Solirubrobacterales bacterium]